MVKKVKGSEIDTVKKDSAITHSPGQAVSFEQTKENIELLKSSLSASGTNLSDSELGLFLYQAQKTGLDPLARQIYVMKRGSGGVTFMTSIDGQRLVAQRTHEYDGQTPPQWCGSDGIWRDVWLENGDPAAARVGVYRTGMREPVYGIATWKSYNQGKGQWLKMGDVMLAKCAEALALRKAFPQELSGLYTAEEINNEEGDAPRRPSMTAREAMAAAGDALMKKGFNRDQALSIILNLAEVDDSASLTGTHLRPVLEIIAREDAEMLANYITVEDDDITEGEIVDVRSKKSVSQAMADGDEEMPEGFLKKSDAAPVTDDDLAAVEGSPAEKTPSWILPEFKKGASNLARPEMIKLYKKWLSSYGLTKQEEIAAFCNEVIGKKAPGTFDEYSAMLDALCIYLNERAEQAAIV